MNITNFLKTVAFTLAFAASTAFAHGDEHAMKHAYDPATVEETAFGHAGNPEEVSRIVNVSMSDAMRFTPSDIAVKAAMKSCGSSPNRANTALRVCFQAISRPAWSERWW